MRRQTFGPPGRRGTVIAASAAVLCLGGVLAGCGDGTGGDGYTAVGAAQAAPGKAPSGAVAPSGKVTLVPLDGDERGDERGGGDRSGAGRRGGSSPSPGSSAAARGAGGGAEVGGAGGSGGAGGADAGRPGAPGRAADGSGGAGDGGTTGGGSTGGASPTGGSPAGGSGSGGSTGPATPSAPGSTAPAGAAVLKVGAPGRAAADKRWCEKVTVEFRNTGGSPVRSGTVTFATHIIGGLGIDWATRESTAPLPAPIGAGAARKKTYTVCVDAWRVPLGMHVETRDVTAVWK
ncbi:hypothetical protein [Streptomyces laculatispora]|uniref:hypothetical protein n=1 Tax=Streptomyces laculatispora TaxID=887464 RepID=UPI001A943452|nr:hypothetical protein [Streptomyces laculatispora]MBO0917313.1 hypothetical protein [Streptomyces laculatispora]